MYCVYIPIDLCMVVSNSLPPISAYSGVMYTTLTLPLCVCVCVRVCIVCRRRENNEIPRKKG